ncbi:MAG: hypothetical protein ACTSX2_13175 [Candidatus Thorarchaeota archaeon]
MLGKKIQPSHRRVLRILGSIAMVAAILLLLDRIISNWKQGISFLTSQSPGALLSTFLLTTFVLILMGIGWVICLRAIGVLIHPVEGMRVYYRASIFRYLPGGVWQFPSRAHYASQIGINLPTYMYSTFLELYLLLGTCVSIIISYNCKRIGRIWCLGTLLFLLALSAYILTTLHIKTAKTPSIEVHERVHGRRLVAMICLAIISYLMVWVSYGASIFILLQASPEAKQTSFWEVLHANAIAWATGFLSFAPLGTGVREIGLSTMLGSTLSTAAIISSLIQRAFEHSIEAVFWLIALKTSISRERDFL